MEAIPDEATLSAGMRKFVEIFVDSCARAGERIGWDTASALRLDGVCAVPPTDQRRRLCM
jgi:hypothetical protein